MAAEYDAELRVVERTIRWGRFAGALAISGLVASYVARLSSLLGLLSLGAGVLTVIGMRHVLLVSSGRARVHVDGAGIRLIRVTGALRERRMIPRSEIASGFFVPTATGGRVLLQGPDGKELLEVHVDGEPQGLAVLGALGLDASKQRFACDVASPLGDLIGSAGSRVLAWLGLGGIVGAFLYAGLSPVYPIAILSVLALVIMWPQRVEVAADGILISWFGRSRFIPFASVVEVVTSNRIGVKLVLKTGDSVVVARDDSVAALSTRVHEAFDAYRERSSSGLVAVSLERAKRDVPHWLDDLRALREGQYRTRAIDDEALLRVVEDPSAAPDARAAAVVLLRPTLNDLGRERIRVASASTAEPHLRVELDALVDAPEEEIEGRLERLR